MTRVLHVTRDFPPPVIGGVSSGVDGLVSASTAAGIEASVVSFDRWRPRRNSRSMTEPVAIEADGVWVLRVEDVSQLNAASDLINARPVDLIHVHDALLWRFAKGLAHDTPMAFSLHVNHELQHRLRGLETASASLEAERHALAEADLIVAPSKAVASMLHVDHPQRVATVPLVPATPLEPERAGDNGSVLYVGRFGDMKGTDLLAAVVCRVLACSATARFVVAGGLPANPKAERRWRRRLAAVGGDRLVFSGWCTPREVSRHYREAAVLVAPSRNETYGLVVAEAMRHGLCVVASRIPALSELVSHDVTGMLVPPEQPEVFADVVLDLLADPATRQRLGHAAAACARTEWSWSASVGLLSSAYARVTKVG